MPETWQTLEFIQSIATVIEAYAADWRNRTSERELLGLKRMMPFPFGREAFEISSSDDTN